MAHEPLYVSLVARPPAGTSYLVFLALSVWFDRRLAAPLRAPRARAAARASLALAALAALAAWQASDGWDAGCTSPPGALGTSLLGASGRVMADEPEPGAARVAAHVALGAYVLLAVFLLLAELVAAASPPSRRDGTRAAFAAAAALLTAASVAEAMLPLAVWERDVHVDNLPPAMDGVRVALLSDLHTGVTLGRTRVAEAAEALRRRRPHALTLAGDVAEGPASAGMRDALSPLGRLAREVPLGAFWTTGNHDQPEWQAGWTEALAGMGIRRLRDEAVLLGCGGGLGNCTAGAGGGGLAFVGTDDLQHGGDAVAAMAGVPEGWASVAVAHQPNHAPLLASLGAGLVLSGHTHGGGVVPIVWPLVKAANFAVAGVSELRGQGNATTKLAVTRGLGQWGPPLRLLSRPEVAVITLRAAAASPAPPPRREL